MNKSKKRICGSMAVGAIIALVIAAPASATLQTLDVVLETDKTVYRLPHPPLPTWSQYYPGDDVQITVSLHNNSDQELTFWSGLGGGWYEWNVYIYENAAGLDPMYLLYNADPIWQAVCGFLITSQPYPWVVLQPGEAWELTRNWNLMGGMHDLPVPVGEYELVFMVGDPSDAPYSPPPEGIVINRSEMSKRITVVPEPGTLSLLAGLAAAGLLRKARRRIG